MGNRNSMSLSAKPKPQEVFQDFCDSTGFLPKGKVGNAVRCLGENPLESEIHEIIKKFKENGLTFKQFEDVLRICKAQNQSPTDELSESLSVFDVDGEGYIPMSHLSSDWKILQTLSSLFFCRHLLTSDASGEGLTPVQVDFLLDTLEVNEDGRVRIADIVTLIQQK